MGSGLKSRAGISQFQNLVFYEKAAGGDCIIHNATPVPLIRCYVSKHTPWFSTINNAQVERLADFKDSTAPIISYFVIRVSKRK